MNAMSENTQKIVEQLKEDNERKYEAVKELIQASEERAVLRASGRDSDSAIENGEESTVNSKKGKVHVQKVSGIDVICDEDKMTWSLCLWVCDRVYEELNSFWVSSDTDIHNSTLALMFFGVTKPDGHSPYGTSIGKEAGLQARMVVGRLMWSARCDSPNKSKYSNSLPRWLFALVPVVRHSYVGTPYVGNNMSSAAPNSASNANLSSNSSSGEAGGSRSTRQSEPVIVDDYRDIADYNAAWSKERDLFKAAVAAGCRAVEQKKKRQNPRKITKRSQMDVTSHRSHNTNLRAAQKKIEDGSEAARKRCSSYLTTNRFNCRQQFFDAIGFILYKFNMVGEEKAKAEGFKLDMPSLSWNEKEVFLSREKFNRSIPSADTQQGSDLSDIAEGNMRKAQDITQMFPNLIVKLEYPVRIIDSPDGRRQRDTSEDVNVPSSYVRKETISLISLSLVLLTEYTRSGDSAHFLSMSKKSIHAVIAIAMALRALILRTMKQKPDNFESYVLGNVYFHKDGIEENLKAISSTMCFQSEESNINRMNKKLSITKKRYIEEGLLDESDGDAGEDVGALFDNDDDDDIFRIPSPSD